MKLLEIHLTFSSRNEAMLPAALIHEPYRRLNQNQCFYVPFLGVESLVLKYESSSRIIHSPSRGISLNLSQIARTYHARS